MLPPFIIEQIRRREEEEVPRDDRPALELPLPPAPRKEHRPEEPAEERGVVIIDLMA